MEKKDYNKILTETVEMLQEITGASSIDNASELLDVFRKWIEAEYPNNVIKDFNQLKGYHFVIPSYQRGFRWSRKQIKYLINDLLEFVSSDKNRKKYSLQPLVVEKKEKDGKTVFEVVDGQQRLTAMWVLMVAYRCSKEDNDIDEIPDYILEYEGKENLTKYVKKVWDNPNEYKTDVPDDIDSKNICDLLKFIVEENNLFSNRRYDEALSIIFENICFNQSQDKKELFYIWDELSEDENQIEKFINMNANKIPLTECEKIKAILLKNSENWLEESKLVIQWENIEKELNDQRLWKFITCSNDLYEYKRMNLLFEVWASNIESNEEGDSLSAIVQNYVKEHNSSESCWREVKKIFDTVIDWYNDYYLYHMIGVLIEVSKEKTAKVINDLYSEYKKCKKTSFKENIRKKILNTYKKNNLLSCTDDSNNEIVINIDNLTYGENNVEIKNVLLLFNIAILVNAYETKYEKITQSENFERFPFEFYKNKENGIEIEHINPQHPEKKEEEYTSKQWIDDMKEIYKDKNNNNDNNDIDIPNGNLTEKDFQNIEKLGGINDFANLTLLDKSLNVGCSNKPFNKKREHIIAAQLGLPKPRNEEGELEEGKRYEKSVVLPGTNWVFMRQYTTNSIKNYWTKEDKKEYEKTIKANIEKLLGGNDETE